MCSLALKAHFQDEFSSHICIPAMSKKCTAVISKDESNCRAGQWDHLLRNIPLILGLVSSHGKEEITFIKRDCYGHIKLQMF